MVKFTCNVILVIAFLSLVGYAASDSCLHTFEKIGCYDDKAGPNIYPEYLHNREMIIWGKFPETLYKQTCNCAKLAKEAGYTYFAIEHWGECWSGPSTNYARDGRTDECMGVNFSACNDSDSTVCTGQVHTIYVYKIKEDLCEKYKGEGSTCMKYHDKVIISFDHDREQDYTSSGHALIPENILITYQSQLPLIKSVVQDFSYCLQRFHMESKNVLKNLVFLLTVNGNRLKTTDVDCHNCAAALDDITELRYFTPKKAYGEVVNKSLLPLRGIQIAGTGAFYKYVKIRFEKLVCTQML